MTAPDPNRPRRTAALGDLDEEATAAGVYGLIVSSAVMAASRVDRVVGVAVSVLFTLLVYWTAERYSRLVAERIHDGRPPDWQQVRHQLTRGWEMVTASGLPLATLLLTKLLGVGLTGAIVTGLACSTLLLARAGWEMGRNGQLTRTERVVSTLAAAGLGLSMILLKALLH